MTASAKKYDIDSLLENVVTLPSMPGVVSKVTAILDNPKGSLADAADAIALDPAMTLKTLRLVNSAFYGLRMQVTGLRHAVNLLGAKVIRNLCLSATVFENLKDSPTQLITHSVACGVGMRALAEIGPISVMLESPEEAFILGLIHDIGKTIFASYLPAEFAETVALAQRESLPSHQAEQKIIGLDHAELGAHLARHWKLGDMLINVIAGHHDLTRCAEPFLPLAASLTIADYIAGKCGFAAQEKPIYEIPPEVWTAAGMDGKTIADVIDRFIADVPKMDELIALAS